MPQTSLPEKVLYSPKLQLVVIFSKADVAIFPGLEILPMYLLGLVAVGDWTFLFFSLSSNQTPNLDVFRELKVFCRELAGMLIL
jgi:hypothetical protein